ncbi:MAG: hypothetical protein K6U88_09150 [Dehalococcoidia bacterium]|nr:hypothetical protein [Dehalococcoidia bacterium]
MREAVDRAAPPLPFAVIGLGKLGARELNVASDLDLVFVYEGEGPEDLEAAVRCAERVLAEIRAAGWEPDADLRPEGRSGPLARSLAGFLEYWQRYADPWEFQALLRARAVAGDVVAVGDAGFEGDAVVAVAGHRGEAAHLLDNRAEADVAALGAGLPVAGHGDEDDVGPGLAEDIVAEPEVIEDVGAVVLDDDVAVRDEAEEGFAAERVSEVEGKGLLVAVVVVEVVGGVPGLVDTGQGDEGADVVPGPG